MSRLGLSSQVHLALQQNLNSQLAQLGPAGQAASMGINAMGGSLMPIPALGLAAGGAVLGLGLAGASLVRRGMPEIEAYQQAINVLAASGERRLRAVQE